MEKKQLLDSKKQPNRALIMVVVAVSNMSAWCCISLIAPFYPLEASKKGVSNTVVGALYSSSELVIFFAAPICAKLLPSVSPRFFYIMGLCLFGSCDVMFGFLNRSPPGMPFIAISFAVRMVEAVGTACVMTASYAIAGNTFPEKTGTVYSILQTSMSAGFVMGPAIGGILYEAGGFGLPFWVLGGLVVVCGFASYVVLPHQEYVPEKSEHSVFSLLRSPLVWFGAGTVLVLMVCVTFRVPGFAEHLLQFNLNAGFIGWIFLLNAAAFSLTSPLWGLLLDKDIPPIPFVIGGLLSSFCNMLLFGPAPFLTFIPTTLWLTIVTTMFVGICASPAMVGGTRCVMMGVKSLGLPYNSKTFGLVGGVMQSSICLGTFSGPLLGGLFTDLYGFGWAMAVCAFIYTLPVIMICPFLPRVLCRTGGPEKVKQKDDYELWEAHQQNGKVKHPQEPYK